MNIKLNRIEVLSMDEIQSIHDATMELMETTGVRIESEKARRLLKVCKRKPFRKGV